jgi:glycosyltransferase involved in cell wall biosynthesis
MRILMLGWEFPPRIAGGLGTACHGLTRALDRLGHEVCFVLPDPRGKGTTRRRAGFRHAEFIAVRAGFEQPYRRASAGLARYGHDLGAEAQRYASLVAALAPRGFDVVHAHDWLTFPAGLAVSSLIGLPLVVHIHSTEQDRAGGLAPGASGRGAADVEALAVRAADRVIAVSGVTRSACVERYGADPARIAVVHNGIDGRPSVPAPRRRAGASERVVLFLGRVTAQKGPALFLLAARRVLERAPAGLGSIRFVMAGDGDELGAMKELATDLGIRERVEFPGFVRARAVARAYAESDVFVMTSLAEPFGLTALEAIKHGVPAILPPWAGATEVIPAAPTCRPDDADALATRILAVLADPEGASAMVGAAQAGLRRFTWLRAAEACAAQYGAAIEGRRTAAARGRAAAVV